MESIAGHSHGNTFVRAPSRNARLDAQDSSNQSLKRGFDATRARDTETLHRRESQHRRNSQSRLHTNSVTLPERSGDPATEASPTDQSNGAARGESAFNRNGEDTIRISATTPQASPALAEHDVLVDRIEDGYALPSQTDETWTAQDMSSLGEIASIDMAMLPDHVLSPSISSSYNFEDGIFEPGSAYQNLFQSLRSHVLRTAQIESAAPENSHAPVSHRFPIAPSHSDAFGDRSTRTAGNSTRNGMTTKTQEFELPPAQEYLLWKAWTEEVSIWVCKAFLSFATIEVDENLA